MTRILTVVCALLMLAIAGCATPTWVGIDRLNVSLKKIFVETAPGVRDQICSASVLNVAHGLLLTASHCVPVDPHLTLWVDGQRAYTVAMDNVADLAVIQ